MNKSLRDFQKRMYSAQYMTLAVISGGRTKNILCHFKINSNYLLTEKSQTETFPNTASKGKV